jgi:CRISPR-associated protein Cas2
MIEPKAGIFLGRMTARIRDELWKKAVAKSACGACFQAWSSPGEQGFQVRTHGEMTRKIIDLEGLSLVAIEAG